MESSYSLQVLAIREIRRCSLVFGELSSIAHHRHDKGIRPRTGAIGDEQYTLLLLRVLQHMAEAEQ